MLFLPGGGWEIIRAGSTFLEYRRAILFPDARFSVSGIFLSGNCCRDGASKDSIFIYTIINKMMRGGLSGIKSIPTPAKNILQIFLQAKNHIQWGKNYFW